MPALDIGLPYFARFSGVSGTGPLVVAVLVTDVPAASVVVTEVEVAAPTGATLVVESVEVGVAVLGAVVVVVVVLVPGGGAGCCARAAPPMRAVAAAAVSRCWIFMAWVSIAFVGN